MRKLMRLAGLAMAGGWGVMAAAGQTADPGQPEKEAAPTPLLESQPVKPEAGKPEAAKPAEAPSNQDPAAKEKFDEFEKAMKDVKSLTFTAVFSVDGRGKEMFGTIEAKVLASQGEKGWAYRTTGKGRRTAKAPENEFDIAYAEGNATWVDKDAKKLITRPVTTARGKALDTASNLRSLGNLFQTPSLAKERAAKDLTLRDSEKVGDVECDVVVSSAGGTSGEMVVYIAKSDHLPRKIVSERTTSAGTTMSVLEFKDFKANGAVEASALEIALPEGFTREETHASAAKPAKPVDGAKPPQAATEPPKALPLPEGAPEASKPEATETMPIDPTPAPSRPPAPGTDVSVPPFELKTLDGQVVTNESLRGQPAVVVFIGTWSLSSKKAYPELKATAERYKDKARVYAASVRQRDAKDAKRALTDAGVEVPLLVAADKLAEQLRVGSFPAVYVIGADGDLLKHPTTAKVEDAFAEVRAALDAALGMAPAAPAPAKEETPKVSDVSAEGAVK